MFFRKQQRKTSAPDTGDGTTDNSPLTADLRDLFYHIRRTRFREGLLRSLAVVTALFLTGCTIDLVWTLSFNVRCFLAVLLYAGFGAALFLFCIRQLLRRFNPIRQAWELEAAYPELEEKVVSAVEIQRRSSPGVSPEMTRSLTDEAQLELSLLNPASRYRVSRRTTSVALALLGICLLLTVLPVYPMSDLVDRVMMPSRGDPPLREIRVVIESPVRHRILEGEDIHFAVSFTEPADKPVELITTNGVRKRVPMRPVSEGDRFVHTMENVRREFRFRVESQSLTSRLYRIQVRQRPRVKTFRITYRYPDYVPRADKREIASSTGNLKALKGTRATLKVNTSKALSSAHVQLPEQEVSGELRDKDRQAVFRFTLRNSGRYTIQLKDKQGLTPLQPLRFQLTALPDKPPSVKWQQPSADGYARPGKAIQLKWTHQDDFQVQNQTLIVYATSVSEPARIPVPAEQTRYRLRPEELDAHRGTELIFRIRVKDGAGNEAVSGARHRVIADRKVLKDCRTYLRILGRLRGSLKKAERHLQQVALLERFLRQQTAPEQDSSHYRDLLQARRNLLIHQLTKAEQALTELVAIPFIPEGVQPAAAMERTLKQTRLFLLPWLNAPNSRKSANLPAPEKILQRCRQLTESLRKYAGVKKVTVRSNLLRKRLGIDTDALPGRLKTQRRHNLLREARALHDRLTTVLPSSPGSFPITDTQEKISRNQLKKVVAHLKQATGQNASQGLRRTLQQKTRQLEDLTSDTAELLAELVHLRQQNHTETLSRALQRSAELHRRIHVPDQPIQVAVDQFVSRVLDIAAAQNGIDWLKDAGEQFETMQLYAQLEKLSSVLTDTRVKLATVYREWQQRETRPENREVGNATLARAYRRLKILNNRFRVLRRNWPAVPDASHRKRFRRHLREAVKHVHLASEPPADQTATPSPEDHFESALDHLCQAHVELRLHLEIRRRQYLIARRRLLTHLPPLADRIHRQARLCQDIAIDLYDQDTNLGETFTGNVQNSLKESRHVYRDVAAMLLSGARSTAADTTAAATVALQQTALSSRTIEIGDQDIPALHKATEAIAERQPESTFSLSSRPSRSVRELREKCLSTAKRSQKTAALLNHHLHYRRHLIQTPRRGAIHKEIVNATELANKSSLVNAFSVLEDIRKTSVVLDRMAADFIKSSAGNEKANNEAEAVLRASYTERAALSVGRKLLPEDTEKQPPFNTNPFMLLKKMVERVTPASSIRIGTPTGSGERLANSHARLLALTTDLQARLINLPQMRRRLPELFQRRSVQKRRLKRATEESVSTDALLSPLQQPQTFQQLTDLLNRYADTSRRALRLQKRIRRRQQQAASRARRMQNILRSRNIPPGSVLRENIEHLLVSINLKKIEEAVKNINAFRSQLTARMTRNAHAGQSTGMAKEKPSALVLSMHLLRNLPVTESTKALPPADPADNSAETGRPSPLAEPVLNMLSEAGSKANTTITKQRLDKAKQLVRTEKYSRATSRLDEVLRNIPAGTIAAPLVRLQMLARRQVHLRNALKNLQKHSLRKAVNHLTDAGLQPDSEVHKRLSKTREALHDLAQSLSAHVYSGLSEGIEEPEAVHKDLVRILNGQFRGTAERLQTIPDQPRELDKRTENAKKAYGSLLQAVRREVRDCRTKSSRLRQQTQGKLLHRLFVLRNAFPAGGDMPYKPHFPHTAAAGEDNNSGDDSTLQYSLSARTAPLSAILKALTGENYEQALNLFSDHAPVYARVLCARVLLAEARHRSNLTQRINNFLDKASTEAAENGGSERDDDSSAFRKKTRTAILSKLKTMAQSTRNVRRAGGKTLLSKSNARRNSVLLHVVAKHARESALHRLKQISPEPEKTDDTEKASGFDPAMLKKSLTQNKPRTDDNQEQPPTAVGDTLYGPYYREANRQYLLKLIEGKD